MRLWLRQLLRTPVHKWHVPFADLGLKWLLTCPCITQIQQRRVPFLSEGKTMLPEKVVEFV